MIKFPLKWEAIKEKFSFLKNIPLPKGDKKKMAVGFAAGVVVCFLVISAGVGVAVYRNHSRASFVRVWSSVVPYPVAIAGSHLITYSEYLKDLGALENFYARQQQLSGLPAPTEGELEQAVVDRLLRNIALENLAKEKNISVTKEDVDRQFAETVAAPEIGTKEAAEKLIEELYGWNSQTFKERVLIYYLLEQKLGIEAGSAEAFSAEIEDAMAKLKEKRFFGSK